MALAKDLMQVGIPDQAAVRLGFQVATVAAAGSTAADATVLKASQTLVIGSGTASQGYKMPADAELGVPYVIANTSNAAILIYPPTNGQINGDTATTGTVPLTARGTSILIRLDATNWCSVGGAAG
jgi:hypothetical protein